VAGATLQTISDTLSKIKGLAMSYSTSTPHTQDTFTKEVKDLTEQIYAFANNTFLGQYLFSGSRTATKPFEEWPQPPIPPLSQTVANAAGSNNGASSGVTAGGGPFTGTVSKTYIVRIVDNSPPPHGPIPVGSADYQISSDGGKTWTDVSGAVGWSGSDIEVDGPGGPALSFAGTDVYKDDVFYLEATPDNYYRGDDLTRDLKIGPNTTMAYAIPGSQIFLPTTPNGVDIFKVLAELQDAMDRNDEADINIAIDKLTIGRQQVEHGLASVGIKDVRFKVAENHLTLLDKTMADLVDKTESSNVEELAMLLAMQKISLDATYSMAARMQQTTILNFLR
jgi:flagellin-like hook-associated protein FlgL